MKKILGIIVLGLLLSGNAYAADYSYTFKNYETKKEYVGSSVGSNTAHQEAYSKCVKDSRSSFYCLMYKNKVGQTVWNKNVKDFENSCNSSRTKECNALKSVKAKKSKNNSEDNLFSDMTDIFKNDLEFCMAKVYEDERNYSTAASTCAGASKGVKSCMKKVYSEEGEWIVAAKLCTKN